MLIYKISHATVIKNKKAMVHRIIHHSISCIKDSSGLGTCCGLGQDATNTTQQEC